MMPILKSNKKKEKKKKNKSCTSLRSIRPRRKDLFDTHSSSKAKLAGYSGKVQDKSLKAASPVSKKKGKGKGSRKGRYFYAVGRRKRAVAQVKLLVGKGKIIVNNRDYQEYFPTLFLRTIIKEAQSCIGRPDGFDVEVKVKGGGVRGQAEAVRHGTTRALVLFEPNFRKKLKRAGFLKRDPRKKERKKYGLKRARRAPQWSKR